MNNSNLGEIRCDRVKFGEFNTKFAVTTLNLGQICYYSSPKILGNFCKGFGLFSGFRFDLVSSWAVSRGVHTEIQRVHRLIGKFDVNGRNSAISLVNLGQHTPFTHKFANLPRH